MAVSRPLPPNPSLESLKRQAKALLRSFRADDPAARERVVSAHPRPDRFSGLRDAQLVIAREYGLSGWDDLRIAVEAANLAGRAASERVEALLRDACLDYQDDSPRRRARAQRLLDADPALAGRDAYTAAATGSVEALRALLAEDPGAATRAGGPHDWEPLLYLAYARLPSRPGSPLEAARVLLDAGADPDAHFLMGDDTYRFTVLTGVMGEGEGGLENQPPHPDARALAELLLARGADPNESQGLYDTHFTPGDEWLELFLAHGLTAAAPANWLDEGGMGTLDYLLGQAVVAGRTERVELLLAHGADPNGVDLYDERTHYENARLHGRTELAELLVERGAAASPLSPASAFQAACMADDPERARALLADDPALAPSARLVHDAIQHGSDAAVRLVFELGGRLDAPGRHFGETPLHQAAIRGRVAVVDHLLALGARLDLRDPTFDSTAVGWAYQGRHHELCARLLDRSDDVFDLAAWGRAEGLRRVLEADPTQARRTRAEGVTALHGLGVAGGEGAEVIDLLLAHGADLDAVTDDGATPLEAALERDEEDVAELLRERGARDRAREPGRGR